MGLTSLSVRCGNDKCQGEETPQSASLGHVASVSWSPMRHSTRHCFLDDCFFSVIFISWYLWIPTAFPCGICGLRCAERSHVFINIMRTIRVDGWYQRISPVSGISFSWFSISFTGLYTHITSVTSFCPIKLIIPYWNSFLSKRILQ